MIVKSISFSSDKKLARCEQQFDYRYGQQLKLKTKKLGLFRGDWFHQLLQAYNLTGDWRPHFKVLKKQWNKLFDEEKEYYGITMPDEIFELMEHYQEHWDDHKHLKILHVEKRFELMTKMGVPLRWVADLIAVDQGETILFETKAKKNIPTSEERILEPQVHSYAYLLSKVGIKIDRIIWNYIKTEPVTRPRINKDGSLSKRQIITDQRGYLKSLKEAELMPDNEEDVIGLNNILDALPETLSLERVIRSVNLDMGKMFVTDWIERHKRAMQIKRPLRSWNRNCKFDCDFYTLCQADMRGDVDRDLIIKKDFLVKIKEAEELK